MKKNILIFIITFVVLQTGIAQNTFSTVIKHNLDFFPTDIIETSNHDFLIASAARIPITSNYVWKTYIYKLNPEGTLTDSLIINEEGRISVIRKIEQLDDGNYIAWGSYETDQFFNYDFWQIIFDENLNIISELKTPTNYGFLKFINTTKNKHNNYIVAGTYHTDANQVIFSSFFLKEITPQGIILKDTSYLLDGWNNIADICYSPKKDLYYAATRSTLSTNSSREIIVFDTNFSIYEISSLYPDMLMGLSPTVNFVTDSTFVLACNYRSEADEKLLGVYELSDKFEIKNHIYIGTPSDTMWYAGVFNNLSFITTDQLFFGSTKGVKWVEWPNSPSYIQLDCLDENLNIKHEKYYGGDAYYVVHNVLASHDEGCVLMATRYSYGNNNIKKRNIAILKVDANGLLTSNNNQINIPIKNAIIMPNPGTNYLELYTGAYPSELQLFNINGQLVLSKEIYNESSRINTEILKSGTYIWHLVKGNEVVENGKWVKTCQ